MTEAEKKELKKLLFNEANNSDEEGVLAAYKRQNVGDVSSKKLGRVKQLVEKI